MRKLIVLDTNILIRAILAERVPNLLDKYHYNYTILITAVSTLMMYIIAPSSLAGRGLGVGFLYLTQTLY